MGKNVLLIMEGDSDEPKFFNTLFSKCNRKAEYKFYSYRTTIHILSQALYNDCHDFDDGYIRDVFIFIKKVEFYTSNCPNNVEKLYFYFMLIPKLNNYI